MYKQNQMPSPLNKIWDALSNMFSKTPEDKINPLLKTCASHDREIAKMALQNVANVIKPYFRFPCNGYIGMPTETWRVVKTSIDWEKKLFRDGRVNVIKRGIDIAQENLQRKLEENNAAGIEYVFIEPFWSRERLGFEIMVIYNVGDEVTEYLDKLAEFEKLSKDSGKDIVVK